MKLLAIVSLLVAGAGSAAAYPHFQRSSATVRCSQCHIAPAGGGLHRVHRRGRVKTTRHRSS